MEKKRSIGVLVFGILVMGSILFGDWCIWSSQVYPESETQLKPIEKLTRKFFIKEITVYEDHIVIQIDKDWVMSERPYFLINNEVTLNAKDHSTFRRRQSELAETGRVELQIGEAIDNIIAHYICSAFLREIKGEIAYIEVKAVYSDIKGPDFDEMSTSILDEYTVEINKLYISKRPEKQ